MLALMSPSAASSASLRTQAGARALNSAISAASSPSPPLTSAETSVRTTLTGLGLRPAPARRPPRFDFGLIVASDFFATRSPQPPESDPQPGQEDDDEDRGAKESVQADQGFAAGVGAERDFRSALIAT